MFGALDERSGDGPGSHAGGPGGGRAHRRGRRSAGHDRRARPQRRGPPPVGIHRGHVGLPFSGRRLRRSPRRAGGVGPVLGCVAVGSLAPGRWLLYQGCSSICWSGCTRPERTWAPTGWRARCGVARDRGRRSLGDPPHPGCASPAERAREPGAVGGARTARRSGGLDTARRHRGPRRSLPRGPSGPGLRDAPHHRSDDRRRRGQPRVATGGSAANEWWLRTHADGSASRSR